MMCVRARARARNPHGSWSGASRERGAHLLEMHTRSCFHLHIVRMCRLPTYGLPHVALRGARGASQPGARAIRIETESLPLDSVSYAIASVRFARPVCIPSCTGHRGVDRVLYRVYRTDGRA